jgi:hypothetical protein
MPSLEVASLRLVGVQPFTTDEAEREDHAAVVSGLDAVFAGHQPVSPGRLAQRTPAARRERT